MNFAMLPKYHIRKIPPIYTGLPGQIIIIQQEIAIV